MKLRGVGLEINDPHSALSVRMVYFFSRLSVVPRFYSSRACNRENGSRVIDARMAGPGGLLIRQAAGCAVTPFQANEL